MCSLPCLELSTDWRFNFRSQIRAPVADAGAPLERVNDTETDMIFTPRVEVASFDADSSWPQLAQVIRRDPDRSDPALSTCAESQKTCCNRYG